MHCASTQQKHFVEVQSRLFVMLLMTACITCRVQVLASPDALLSRTRDCHILPGPSHSPQALSSADACKLL